jgi:hypothetical protein
MLSKLFAFFEASNFFYSSFVSKKLWEVNQYDRVIRLDSAFDGSSFCKCNMGEGLIFPICQPVVRVH